MAGREGGSSTIEPESTPHVAKEEEQVAEVKDAAEAAPAASPAVATKEPPAVAKAADSATPQDVPEPSAETPPAAKPATPQDVPEPSAETPPAVEPATPQEVPELSVNAPPAAESATPQEVHVPSAEAPPAAESATCQEVPKFTATAEALQQEEEAETAPVQAATSTPQADVTEAAGVTPPTQPEQTFSSYRPGSANLNPAAPTADRPDGGLAQSKAARLGSGRRMSPSSTTQQPALEKEEMEEEALQAQKRALENEYQAEQFMQVSGLCTCDGVKKPNACAGYTKMRATG